MKYATLGSVSHGTMRPEDLINTFALTLETILRDCDNHVAPAYADLIKAAEDLAYDPDADVYEDQDEARAILDQLFDALYDFAPPYCYFGAHIGDGSDYGFWPLESFQDNMRDDGVLQVDDLSKIPDDYRGEVLLVNDHGNCTFGYVDSDGSFVTVWAIV